MQRYNRLLVIATLLCLYGCCAKQEAKLFGLKESKWLALSDYQRQQAIEDYYQKREVAIISAVGYQQQDEAVINGSTMPATTNNQEALIKPIAINQVNTQTNYAEQDRVKGPILNRPGISLDSPIKALQEADLIDMTDWFPG